MSDDRRRLMDPLLEDLIKQMGSIHSEIVSVRLEVDQMRDALKPIKAFMDDITSIRRVLMWIIGGLATIAAIFKFLLDMRDQFHKGP